MDQSKVVVLSAEVVKAPDEPVLCDIGSIGEDFPQGALFHLAPMPKAVGGNVMAMKLANNLPTQRSEFK